MVTHKQLKNSGRWQSTSKAMTGQLSRKPSSSIKEASPILQLQRSIGNRAVQRLLQENGMQAKLQISQPGDPYEREADQVADRVMRMAEPDKEEAIMPHSTGSALGIQRLCTECEDEFQRKPLGEEEEEVLQAKQETGASSVDLSSGLEPQIQSLRGRGEPLSRSTRNFFEPRFGADFSSVRVHNDAHSATLARSVNAQAFTIGQDVVFGAGQYVPGTYAGDRLIAHELTHSIQQSTDLVHRQEDVCTTRFARARNFSAFIDLVREAETRLNVAGYTSVLDRIHVLRGIYYGTTWSADFRVEGSPVRNAGFQAYTASTTPDDPRVHLNCGLFEALRDSQDLTDGRRRVDVGHLLIGLDARRSRVARNLNIPTQGGSGLDISTWLGDLGGGAGMLAFRRASVPTTNAMTMFHGTDFGGSINLEGDIAGFVVARDTSITPSAPAELTFAGSSTIADALANFLLPTASGTTSNEWNNRCHTFMQMKGATFNSSGGLTNRMTLINRFKGQIEEFACWYLVNRLRQSGRLSLRTLRNSSLHISGASEEIATIFVDSLDACQSTPGSNLEATGSGPAASPIGTGSPTACNLAISGLEARETAEATLRDMERWARELREQLPF